MEQDSEKFLSMAKKYGWTQRQRGHFPSLGGQEGDVGSQRREQMEGVKVADVFQMWHVVFHASSAPWSVTSEPESFGEERVDPAAGYRSTDVQFGAPAMSASQEIIQGVPVASFCFGSSHCWPE